MRTIHRIGADGYWTGESTEIGTMDGVPPGWVTKPLPALATGEFAVWGANAWTLTDQLPGSVPPASAEADDLAAFVGSLSPGQIEALRSALQGAVA